MEWQTKPNRVYLELLSCWLKSEVDKLNNCLTTIEMTKNYQDEYVLESLRTAEIAIRQMRKFISAN